MARRKPVASGRKEGEMKIREMTISVLEHGAMVRVELDDSDVNTLRIRRMLGRARSEDLGVIVITDAGLDLSGLHDRQTEWHLRYLEDMAKSPIPICE